jgi:hypothetical protein
VLCLEGVCHVQLCRERQPDGTFANKYTEATRALFNALRARAKKLKHINLSHTPSLRGAPLSKFLGGLSPGAHLALNCCRISEEQKEKLMEAQPELELECFEDPSQVISAACDAQRMHLRLRPNRAPRLALCAVRCDWDTFQLLLASTVVNRMADAGDLAAVALLGSMRGFVVHMDCVDIGIDYDESKTADLCVQYLSCGAPDDAWQCSAPLRHVAIPFDMQHEEDHDACMLGRFRQAAIAAALQDAIHECFFSVGIFERMRLFALAVPLELQGYHYDPPSSSEDEDEDGEQAHRPPLGRVPPTEAQEAERSAELLEWAAAADEARFVHPERFDPADEPHPWDYVNPQLMAVVDAPGRREDGSGCAWADDVTEGSWCLHEPW